MELLLVGASIFAIVLAVVVAVVALKSLGEKRARSTARIVALQALVADASVGVAHQQQPQHEARIETPLHSKAPAPLLPFAPVVVGDDPFDLALRETTEAEVIEQPIEPTMPARAPIAAQRPVRLAPAVEHRAAPALEPREPAEHVATDSHPLFEETTPRTPGRRWTGMVAASLLMAAAAGVFYLASTGTVGRIIAAAKARTTTAHPSPIELLSLRYAIDTSGSFVVTGLVQNPAASASLKGVFAVVYLFDAEGKFFASSRAALESAVLSPGGEAAFTVRVPATAYASASTSLSASSSLPSVSRYRVSFQQEDGAAVTHVDRRGALPEQTTGDTVATPAGTTPLVTARKD